MRSRIVRHGAAWVLAGVAGWNTVWGQEFGFVPPTASPSPSGAVVAADASQFEIWSLLIEMELLADSATFPYHLKVVPTAEGLELRGYVPSTLIRDRALAAARRVCPLPIADGLVVQRNMSLPIPGRLPKDLESQVRHKLAEACPDTLFEVRISDSGTVHVTGQVPTLHDKVACSRALRKVPGVTAVRNELEVRSASVAQTPPPRAFHHRDVQPLPVRPIEPSVASTGSSVTPMTVTSTSRPATTQAVTQPSDAPMPSPGPSASPVVRPHPTAEGEVSRRYSLMPPPPVTPAAGTLSAEVAERVRPVPPGDVRPVSATETVEKRYEPTPPRFASPATKPTPPAAGTPFVSAAMPDARTQSAIKARIRNAVGPEVRSVEMLFDGRGGLTLILYVDQNANIDQAINRVIQIPDLSGYELRLDFKMVQ